jgi:multiple sugar transport system ATP-binding protein
VVEELGAETHVYFHVDASRVTVVTPDLAEDDAVPLLADEGALFIARVDARTAARPGQRLTLAVDPLALHFFDAATGESLLPPLEAAPSAVAVVAR